MSSYPEYPRRVDTSDPNVRQVYNKCDDCCDVVGCDSCGPCVLHDGEETVEDLMRREVTGEPE